MMSPESSDGGGSNGSKVRLWKLELQQLADEIEMIIHVRHFPPGTSKWNKIEHRMFCHITENWRGRPLESLMTIVNLISNTKTTKGLTISAGLDRKLVALSSGDLTKARQFIVVTHQNRYNNRQAESW